MEDKYQEFYKAAKELDELCQDGFFGERAIQLTNMRDGSMNIDLFKTFIDDWINDNNLLNKEFTAILILVFFKLFTCSYKIKAQLTVDTLSGFIRGYPENPESENLSSYTEFLRSKIESSNLAHHILKSNNIKTSDRIKFGDNLISTYSKGIELINKMLTPCIILLKINSGESFDILKINDMSLSQKISLFFNLSNGQYDILFKNINKEIRNAGSHLNLRFIPSEGVFQMKSKSGKKYKISKIPTNDFVFKYMPQPGYIVQGFMLSNMLLILAINNNQLFREKYLEILKFSRLTIACR